MVALYPSLRLRNLPLTILALSCLLLTLGPEPTQARSRHNVCRPSRHRSSSSKPASSSNSTSGIKNVGSNPSSNNAGTKAANATSSSSTAAVDASSNSRPKAQFKLVDKWQGQSFFDGWEFWDQGDPTHGMVNFLGSADAFNAGLAYIDDDGSAIMRVDNYTRLQTGQYRNSIRIQSKNSYNGGLFLLDVKNMPHGCSVWPAWWTVGPNWPGGGEIDILEGVHDSDVNQMTLHTAEGCSLGDETQNNQIFSGKVLTTTCAANNANNAGCAVIDPSQGSYGKALNAQDGGVFAMLWNNDGIKVWRFDRDSVPDDIYDENPKPSSWPSPRALWAASSCSPAQFFKDHSIIFDTTLCGDWAGATYQSAGCPGTCADAVAEPSNYDNAFWKVNYVKVFQPTGN